MDIKAQNNTINLFIAIMTTSRQQDLFLLQRYTPLDKGLLSSSSLIQLQ